VEFSQYSSIENSYRDKEIEQVRSHGFDKVEWVATEKVHGANFGLWPIDGQVRPSKRSSFADGAFYGCQAIVEGLTPKILSLGFAVYGEIFGSGIQKGVDYGGKRFAAFDIWTGENFLDYDDFVALCDKHGIERCVEIARGNFDDLLAIDPAFPTKMSVVEGCVDIAEGFVMKPIKAVRLGNGSRVILKKKSPGFSEQSRGPKVKVEVILTENQQELLDNAVTYVTMAKLDCVLSKMDDPKFPEVLGAMLQDIYEELGKDAVDLSTWKSIHRHVSGLIAPLVRERLFGVKS
jgi:Rnl2 family RNA ligase